MPEAKRTRSPTVRKDGLVPDFGCAGVSVFVAGWLVWHAWQTQWMIRRVVAGALGGIAGLVALLLVFRLVERLLDAEKRRRTGVCPEPGCEETVSIEFPERDAYGACKRKHYHQYLAETQELEVPDDATVADEPLFESEIPTVAAWPPVCCACGARATTSEQLSLHRSATGKNLALGAAGLLAGWVVVRTGGGVTYQVDAPHCSQHTGGAKLSLKGEAVAIAFRSLRMYRAFREANRRALRAGASNRR